MEISLITCLRSLGSRITLKKHSSLSWTLRHQNPQKSYTTTQNSKSRKDKESGFACWNPWLKFSPYAHKRSHTCRWSKWGDFGEGRGSQSPKWKKWGLEVEEDERNAMVVSAGWIEARIIDCEARRKKKREEENFSGTVVEEKEEMEGRQRKVTLYSKWLVGSTTNKRNLRNNCSSGPWMGLV